jgi:hypothetical protein
MNQECIDHNLLPYLQPWPGGDLPWTVAALSNVIARVMGAQIVLRAHPVLVGSRLDACCLADDRRSYVVFYRADLTLEQATRMQLEVLGRILLGQIAPGVPVCYCLSHGTPLADALLTRKGTEDARVPACARVDLRGLLAELFSRLNAGSG